jgi:hypothetical protein
VPYIPDHKRRVLDPDIDRLGDQNIEAGHLAYCFYRLAGRFYRHHGSGRRGYWKMAVVFGVLILTAFELYRRLVSPYEDYKRTENGDVPL